MIQLKIDEKELILEEILDHDYGCYLWPSALFLAFYLLENEIHGNMLELGAGIGLPGLVAARWLQCNVTLSDRSSNVILDNLRRNALINSINATIVAIDWGYFEETDQKFDYIIGSDIFYDPELFEVALATIYFYLLKNPGAKCLTSYQERSSKRMLDPLLDRYNLTARQVPIELFDFLDRLEERIKIFKGSDLNLLSPVQDISGMSSIFILEISLQ